jgi:hypothetical protein
VLLFLVNSAIKIRIAKATTPKHDNPLKDSDQSRHETVSADKKKSATNLTGNQTDNTFDSNCVEALSFLASKNATGDNVLQSLDKSDEHC